MKNTMDKNHKLSLEDEKYLNKLNGLNSIDLFREQKRHQTQMGIADADGDYILYSILEHSHNLIEYAIIRRMKRN